MSAEVRDSLLFSVARIQALEAERDEALQISECATLRDLANECARARMSEYQLKQDVNALNALLRDRGLGQGEIDLYADMQKTISDLETQVKECIKELS